MTRSDQPAPAPDAAQILGAIGEVAYEWRLDSDALAWAPNAAAVLGFAPEAIASGRAYAQRVEAETGLSRFDAIMRAQARDEGDGVAYQVEYALRGASGETLWLEDTGRWFAGPDGAPERAQGVVRIVNERHAREQRLTRMALFDELTGKLNRPNLIEVLATTLDEAVRFRSSCGFLLVAIDHLAGLNEAYGYDVVDEAIAQVAKRLRGMMRGDDIIGRFTGNKFGIVLKSCTPDELSFAAERLLTDVRDEMVPTAVGPIAMTVTIGGVNAPRHARTVAEILARAQDALDTARGKRHGSFLAYRPNVEREALRRENLRATDEIVAALNQRRILLAYEPVVAVATREPAFYECLLRLQRADGSAVPTSEVVPVAERLGLVRLLDHRVLGMVVDELVAAPTLRASVNLSPVSTMDPEWWAGLAALLRRHQGVGQRLTVEITETSAIQDVDDTRAFVNRVKDLGCRIAIDDFGAGHTSFRNLRKLGVDIVKIDGAFVQNMTKSVDDRAFVQTLIDLARRLGLKTVAEWVQDEETAAMLAGWGCDYLQGVLIGLASTQRAWITTMPRIAAITA